MPLMADGVPTCNEGPVTTAEARRMQGNDSAKAKRSRDSVSAAGPFARIRVIAFLVLLAVALHILLGRWLAG
ncbi:MAG: hypothetical protein OEM24_07250 [Paracoccaceae bacterium]|nr:hypothetical protein [Paracoccaceae bacterium]